MTAFYSMMYKMNGYLGKVSRLLQASQREQTVLVPETLRVCCLQEYALKLGKNAQRIANRKKSRYD